MKKTFYQKNILFQTIISLFLIIFVLIQSYSIYLYITGIKSFITNDNSIAIGRLIFGLFFGIISLAILYLYIRFQHNNVHIKNGKVYINDDWLNRNEKIQFYAEVYIKNIKSIDIVWSSNNSVGNPINGHTIGSSSPKAYLSFITNDEEKINMLILYMTSNEVTDLINDIKNEMKFLNNNNMIEETIKLVNKFKKIE